MSTTRVAAQIVASRSRVYQALLDASAVKHWMVPDGMTSAVHVFEPRVGGRFRISLTYERPDGVGKTAGQTDTFEGRFVELVEDARVVQCVEFETTDSSIRGEMRITWAPSDVAGGTRVEGIHEGLPAGVPPSDNELGWRMSLTKLAAWVERGPPT